MKSKEKNSRLKLTSSGIPIKEIYDKSDVPAISQIGSAGKFPFTRGIHPAMYRERLWTMRQYAGFGTALEANERFKYLLQQGQMGLSIAFDLPTQIGYDSDHALARGEVGRVGVAISTLEDMETLLKGIPLDRVSVSMTINSTAPILLAFYLTLAKKRRISFEKLSGTTQNDILKEYIARGTYIYPPKYSLRLTSDIIEYSAKHLPHWNPISVSGYHIREAGATAVQELAFTIANAKEYIRNALKRNLKIDQFSGRFSFFFGCHNHFLEEISKFRAARRIWAKLMKKEFKAKNQNSCMMRFHTQTDGVTLTAAQPDNNVVRVTVQALAAILGGTQSLHTNAKDEALSIPTEESVLLALRTQQVIALESGVTETVDPLGGSYCIESLTSEIERKVVQILKKIEILGGMQRAVSIGFPQKEISNSSYQYQKEIEEGKRKIVGVNEYRGQNYRIPIHRHPPASEKNQIRRLEKYKAQRPKSKVTESLKKLEIAAMGNSNLFPYILNAVESHATLGEISDTFRKVFGEHKEFIQL